MQYLRDNTGVLESSANGTDWTPVVLQGKNPLPLGTLLLRDNAGALEVSDDDGATWEPVGSGSGVTDHTALTSIGVNTHAQIDTFMTTLPDEISNPTTIGQFQIRDNAGALEVSDDAGVTWEPIDVGLTERLSSGTQNVSFSTGHHLYPPTVDAETIPNLYSGAISLWRKTSNDAIMILFKSPYDNHTYGIPLPLDGDVQNPVEIENPVTIGGLQIRDENSMLEVSDDSGVTWRPVYMVGQTQLTDSDFVPPQIIQSTQPTTADPIMEQEGSLGVWVDSDDEKCYLIYNYDGNVKKVELT